jgi:hypothetical protein
MSELLLQAILSSVKDMPLYILRYDCVQSSHTLSQDFAKSFG